MQIIRNELVIDSLCGHLCISGEIWGSSAEEHERPQKCREFIGLLGEFVVFSFLLVFLDWNFYSFLLHVSTGSIGNSRTDFREVNMNVGEKAFSPRHQIFEGFFVESSLSKRGEFECLNGA